MTWDAELANEEHVERRAERLRDLEPTGTPPRGRASTTTS